MNSTNIYNGTNLINPAPTQANGEYVRIGEETYYKISNFDAMPTFFMTVVSSTDQWLFLGSNGGLSAGRKNSEYALFPYYTDDKILDGASITGSKTIVRVTLGERQYLWEPFIENEIGAYRIQRNLYKNKIGSKVLFEEINLDLQLSFQYEWTFSDAYGFVKSSALKNLGDNEINLDFLDGLQNILPAGVESGLQNNRSTLVDAYKKNELETESGLGIFSLSAMIVDKAIPSESLKANISWAAGIQVKNHLLCSDQLPAFRKGVALINESFVKARRGAYFINAEVKLAPGEQADWIIVSEVDQNTAQVLNASFRLKNEDKIVETVKKDIAVGVENLTRLVGLADGIQKGNDRLATNRHFSNVLFNIMRGGIFEDVYHIDIHDLRDYAHVVNRVVYQDNFSFFNSLNTSINYQQLLASAAKIGNGDVLRICTEYLPLSFSRRHGDPSRPWNNFNIDIHDEHGRKKHNYEGNWRDIFQNWEALAFSFPAFVEGMITKFVNASTIDGYNPYRITREGIDWEVIEPDDPWSYIGYWGDHQIIYLQKLLEHSEAHFPGKLAEMLTKTNYVYANVPYRIRSYESILDNPTDTIDFDHDLEKIISSRVVKTGSDGKLVWNEEGEILKAGFAEKLLVMVLTKMYNFVPDGGIWLNTQRPEWNDANNALVGNGLSMVTLCYMRRFLSFAERLFEQVKGTLNIHSPVAQLLQEVGSIYQEATESLADGFNPDTRKAIMDKLGNAGETYRTKAYSGFDTSKQEVSIDEVQVLFQSARKLFDGSIAKNVRADGLYHAYNLLVINDKGAEIQYLYEMLEGQVAALSAGSLNAEQAAKVLNALKGSAMFRQDQYSYMLYPDRELKPFVEKNNISNSVVEKSVLLKKLEMADNKSLVVGDKLGGYHFAGHLNNASEVKKQLESLQKTGFANEVEKDAKLILNEYEDIFDHKSFTGRSGTFYGYEGLGSIYWHMVSKLLLAVQENIHKGSREGADPRLMGNLIDHFYEIRAGIGVNKSPHLYGAFPTDAYSHTPANGGAQQPGMTGQVKEDVINRWAVLGVVVKNGKISIQPILLRKDEFKINGATFEYYDAQGSKHHIQVKSGELAFTYCGTCFRYVLHSENKISVFTNNGEELVMEGMELSQELSSTIFNRTNYIKEVRVAINI